MGGGLLVDPVEEEDVFISASWESRSFSPKAKLEKAWFWLLYENIITNGNAHLYLMSSWARADSKGFRVCLCWIVEDARSAKI